jgi:hypothetical protein
MRLPREEASAHMTGPWDGGLIADFFEEAERREAQVMARYERMRKKMEARSRTAGESV